MDVPILRPPKTEMPPRTWPEATVPDPEVFLDWLLLCPREYQLKMLGWAQRASAAESACYMGNHVALLTELEHARHAMATAWKRGYDQCRDDAEAAIMAAIERDRSRTATREDYLDAIRSGPHAGGNSE